ncbi:MogA/MoaB family molybdenum cofactor biosynthesis protein [Thermicanus aegyptius]|uniref:MogA/MoaB family molybdenum cofactor biosynthesis protein n=1 Tax=Thermicanus aegyptius TaxID=94009 RepID=UPI000490FE70|nr:MogA/MoaB family molybdenum cofactor biosynthesis protein [Thermicanus aegyptius]
MSHLEHKEMGKKNISCKVITVSDTRTEMTDRSGKKIIALLEENGHTVSSYVIVPDEYGKIKEEIGAGLSSPKVEAILINGGTGISPRDTTYEVVHDLLDKRLDGFGELFRYLSYHEIGSAAMLSRAIAGVVGKKVIFSTPGSTAAVQLAMEKLILPELPHLLHELHKHDEK